MCVTWVGLEDETILVKVAIPYPFFAYQRYCALNDVVGRMVPHQTEIAIDTGKEVLQIRRIGVPVPSPDRFLAIPDNPVTDVCPSGLEPNSDEIPALGVMLAVALIRVHFIAVLLP